VHATGIVIILPGPQVALPGSNHRADLVPPERRSARDHASPRSLTPCIRRYVADYRQAFTWMYASRWRLITRLMRLLFDRRPQADWCLHQTNNSLPETLHARQACTAEQPVFSVSSVACCIVSRHDKDVAQMMLIPLTKATVTRLDSGKQNHEQQRPHPHRQHRTRQSGVRARHAH
jgi:hypothetical protein